MKKLYGEGTSQSETESETDIATTRKNWPKGRFFEKEKWELAGNWLGIGWELA